MKTKATLSKGFTLIETLVALLIFSSAITGILVLTGQGVLSTNYAKNRLTAGFLAQEGIELIRFVRDSAMIGAPSTGWNDFISTVGSLPCGEATNGCTIDSSVLSAPDVASRYTYLVPCTTTGGCPLYYTDTTGYNTTGVGSPSLYKRTITLEVVSLPSSNFLRITSTVTWTQGQTEKIVSATENLFDWVVIP
jgi:prepilin-type N-terminal cleavage/methylation domain-containing protein